MSNDHHVLIDQAIEALQELKVKPSWPRAIVLCVRIQHKMDTLVSSFNEEEERG
jgi:hypothetical protein